MVIGFEERESSVHTFSGPASQVEDERKPSRVLRALPYIVLLILTLSGVAYTSVNKQPLTTYWEALAVLTAMLCIVSGWRYAEGRRVRLV